MQIFWENTNLPGNCIDVPITFLAWAPIPIQPHVFTDSGRKPAKRGLLATGTETGSIGITCTNLMQSDEAGAPRMINERLNFNLRVHRGSVCGLTWRHLQPQHLSQEVQQPLKLLSYDTTGVICIWTQSSDRWTVEFINDRGFKIRDLCWSYDGQNILIVYEDNFVIITTETGHRLWSNNMLISIQCLCWTPTSAIVLGLSNGMIHVMNSQGVQILEQSLFQVEVRRIALSPIRLAKDDAVEDDEHWMLAVCSKNDQIIFLNENYNPDGNNSWQSSDPIHAIAWNSDGQTLAVLCSHSRIIFLDHHCCSSRSFSAPFPFLPVTAFTWIHNDEAIVLSAQGHIAVGRIAHRVPQLSQIVAYTIWERLGKTAKNVAKLPIPRVQKLAIASLDHRIIKCRIPQLDNLQEAICTPSPFRWYCTVIPYPKNTKHCDYMLCIEHMGGLVPILLGRQLSRIAPHFVISLPLHLLSALKQLEHTEDILDFLEKGEPPKSTHSTEGKRQLSLFNSDSGSNERQRQNTIWRLGRRRMKRLVTRRLSTTLGMKRCVLQDYPRLAPPLVNVWSNVWCNRFRVTVSSKNRFDFDLPHLFATIDYKMSVFHLQPRQLTVNLTDINANQERGNDFNNNKNNSIQATIGATNCCEDFPSSKHRFVGKNKPMRKINTNGKTVRCDTPIPTHKSLCSGPQRQQKKLGECSRGQNATELDFDSIFLTHKDAEIFSESGEKHFDISKGFQALLLHCNENDAREKEVARKNNQKGESKKHVFPSTNNSDENKSKSSLSMPLSNWKAVEDGRNEIESDQTDLEWGNTEKQQLVGKTGQENAKNVTQQKKYDEILVEFNILRTAVASYIGRIDSNSKTIPNMKSVGGKQNTAVRKEQCQKQTTTVRLLEKCLSDSATAIDTASSSLKRNRTPASKKDSKTKQKDANANTNNISGSQFRWVKTLFTFPLPLRNRFSARSSSVKKPNEDDERTPLISNTNGGPIVLDAEKAVDGTVAFDNWQLRIENISFIDDDSVSTSVTDNSSNFEHEEKRCEASEAENVSARPMSLTHSTGINANGKGGEETEANIMPQTLENINLFSSNDQQQQRQNQSVTLLASSDKESEDLYRISQRMEQFEELIKLNDLLNDLRAELHQQISDMKTVLTGREIDENLPCSSASAAARQTLTDLLFDVGKKHAAQQIHKNEKPTLIDKHLFGQKNNALSVDLLRETDTNSSENSKESRHEFIHKSGIFAIESKGKMQAMNELSKSTVQNGISKNLQNLSEESDPIEILNDEHKPNRKVKSSLSTQKSVPNKNAAATRKDKGDGQNIGEKLTQKYAKPDRRRRQRRKNTSSEFSSTMGSGTASRNKVAAVDGSVKVPAQNMLTLTNKAPIWNEQSQVYQLDFNGRVTQESAKNFQIEFHDRQVLQFGRIDNGAFTLDFCEPFSAIQAFGVALASITQRFK